MARPTEHLDGKGRVYAPRSFLEETGVVQLRIGNSTEGRTETYPNTILRGFARVGQTGVIKRHFRRRDRELSVAIEPFQTMRREMFFRDPIQNLPGAMSIEGGGIETRDRPDPAFFRAQPAPEILASGPNAGDRA